MAVWSPWSRRAVPHALIEAPPRASVEPLPLEGSAKHVNEPGRTAKGGGRLRASWIEWVLLALAVAIFAATIFPPMVNLGPYRRRIAASLSSSLGRQVTMSSLNLRLLPAPALVLTDVEVHEDRGFGAEPALRAPSVIAQIRLTSLWRGHLEISRVELTDASLNLVRDPAGRWNVGSMLLQASHVANAPTSQRRPGPAPRFPYIEITDSRVNLMQGVEKLPYSLLNANLSMWLADPEVWQIRLDGQPVRTDIDLGLSDTGTLRVEGRVHRATALGNMPLALHADWTNAPLGQASRLILGNDRGWRGDLHATADVEGDLDNLAISTRVAIANLHREEFTPPEPFAVDATCHAAYSRAATRMLQDLSCQWPIGGGQLLLRGKLDVAGASGSQNGDASASGSTLALTVQQLPASFLVAAAGLTRSDFIPAFHLEGTLNGMLFCSAQPEQAPLYAGVLEAPQLRVVAAGMKPLDFSGVRLAAGTPVPSGISTLELTAAPAELGGPAPVRINAQFTSQGFLLHGGGSGSLARIEELGRATHLLPQALAWLAPEGMAEFDITRSGGWAQGDGASSPSPSIPGPEGSSGPRASRIRSRAVLLPPVAPLTQGWLRLRDAKYRPRFLPVPVLLPNALATFLPGEIDWNVPVAIFQELPLGLMASYPLHCSGTPGCITHFQATVGTLDAQALASDVLGTGTDQHLLEQILNRLDSTHWPTIDGTVHAGTFTLGRLALHDASAAMSISDGKTTLRSLDAQALGGALHVEGSITVADGLPHYDLAATLTRASVSAAGALFQENWGGGMLTLSSQVQLAGLDAAQLAASSVGKFHGEWMHGSLGSQKPLARFALWTGDGLIEHQKLTLTDGELTTNAGVLPVTGSIAFDRTLSLHIGAVQGDTTQARLAVTVTGTLAHPAR